VRNTGANASGWWHKVGFRSMTELDNYARQMVARPVDVTSYATASGRRFDAALIDNANAEERRMRGHYALLIDANQNPRGIFQSYLKEVDGPVLVNLNGKRRAEAASALKVLHLLHAMKQVHAGIDFLGAANFVYYNSDYNDAPEFKDRCPIPRQENTGSWNYNVSTLEWGLDRMMDVSDNRTTRGVVLRWGGSFAPFNETAIAAGLTGTTLRHDIGCGYTDLDTDPYTYSPATKRNDTSMADLAKIYEGVWAGRLLGSNSSARREFLESAHSHTGATGQVQDIIDQEAAALGKSAIAQQFGDLVKTWGKGGEYNVCLGDPADRTQCGQGVMVRSSAGLMRLPIGGGGPYVAFRYYVHGKLISDVPMVYAQDEYKFAKAHKKASGELFRSVIREALATW
jgi:beta-lactamase class A